MKDRKTELRRIILNILFKREQVQYPPQNLSALKSGVAEVQERLVPTATSSFSFRGDPSLNANDELIVHEIFWDLIVDKIITIGMDVPNPNFPWFRLHSEAAVNVKTAERKD